MDNTKVFLWSSPRNISTALMYSFAERPDTQVYDEILYAHYLSHSDAAPYHPMSTEILESMENNGKKVIDFMCADSEIPVQFFKNMTHHLLGLSLDFLEAGKNILLTREPREMILSFSKVIPEPSMKDVGYLQQYELLRYLQVHGLEYAVLDSRKLLLNPASQLREICAFSGIPYMATMLDWEAGPREEDGIWAEYWYKNVHKSTGFMEYSAREGELKGALKSLEIECRPYYDELMRYAL